MSYSKLSGLWHTINIHVYIIIIIIIIMLAITFMHGIYNYIPETNHVSRVYSFVAVLCLQFLLHVKLFRPWNKFSVIIIIII